MSDHPSLVSMRLGDTLVIAGVYGTERNPAWRWWTFWRPRRVATGKLQTFRVVDGSTNQITIGDDE